MFRILAVAIVCLAGCAQPPATGDDSRTSLDWPGSYAGVLPCADCQGIETTVTLGKDQTFRLETRYLGKDAQVFRRQGRFSWSASGGAIRLQGLEHGPDQYLVGENRLIQLDLQGNRVAGDLAPRYVLRKLPEAPQALFAPGHWRLVELNGQPVAPAPGGRGPTLRFEQAGSRVSGFGGCNSFTGSFQLGDGNRLRFSQVAATMRACLGPNVEAQFLKVLSVADSFVLSGNALVLNRARMAPLARFEADDGKGVQP